MNNIGHFPQRRLEACMKASQDLGTNYKSKELEKLKEDVDQLSRERFDPIKFSDYKKTVKNLSSMRKQLVSLEEQHPDDREKIESICRSLWGIQRKLLIDKTSNDPGPQREKIDITFCILCDFQCPDANGEVGRDAQFMLENNMPFIATHSIMCGSGTTYNEERRKHIATVAPLLKKWEIFELVTEKNKPSGLFVFLPPGEKGEDNGSVLKKFDLSESGRLVKVNPERVLSSSKESPGINSLKEVFSADPKMNKIFYLVGHGSKKSLVAGISKKEFPDMLKVLKSISCQGLLIDSCFAGGTNSNTFVKNSEPPFPVITCSTGEFVVLPHRETLKSRLNALQDMIENPLTPQTSQGYRKQYESIQQRHERKDFDNKSLMQILLPRSGYKETTSRFYAIGEGNHLFPVTTVAIKQAELTREPITTKGEILGFYTKTVPTTIQASSGTILCSMQPGNASHLIEEISGIESAKELISGTLRFSDTGQVDKGFCIGNIQESSGDSIQEVVVLCTSTETICAYQREGKYYAIDRGKKEFEISPLRHALLYKRAVLLDKKRATTDTCAKALLIANENSSLFYKMASSSKEALKKWGPLIDALVDNKKEVTYEQVENFFTAKEVLKEDKDNLLWRLFLTSPELALKLLENISDLSISATDYTGSPISKAMINSGDLKVIEKFIENGVNFYEEGAKGSSLFDFALESGRWPVIQRLLQIPHKTPLDPTIQLCRAIYKFLKIDQSSPEYSAAKSIIDQVLKETNIDSGFEIFTANDAEQTGSLLGIFALKGNAAAVNLLLEAGCSPNKSDAFYHAFLGKNEAIVELLLKNGANPMLPASDGRVPMIESAVVSSPEVFGKMLQSVQNIYGTLYPRKISNVADARNITLLTAVLISRDPQKIEKILQEQVELPDKGDDRDKKLVEFMEELRTLIVSEDKQFLGLIKKYLTNNSVLNELDNTQGSYLLNNNLFDYALTSLDPASDEFIALIKIAINNNDLERLGKLVDKLARVDLNVLSGSHICYLGEKGLIKFESAYTTLTSKNLREVVQAAIERENRDLLGKLGDDLKNVVSSLSDDDKDYLIKENLINADEMGIDRAKLVLTEEPEGEPDSDSDSD